MQKTKKTHTHDPQAPANARSKHPFSSNVYWTVFVRSVALQLAQE